MTFFKTTRRTSLGPIYGSAEGYELVHDHGRRGWYVRDHTGYIIGHFTTKREATEEATEWFKEFGGSEGAGRANLRVKV